MKKLKLLALAVATFALTACGTGQQPSDQGGQIEDNYQIKVLAPKGAPSLAFYDMADDPNFNVKKPEEIKAEFVKKNYGMIVMEFFTASKIVRQTNSNYRLARILTGGNLYLVSRSGKTTLPTAEDNVLAFGPGQKTGIPYLTLRKLIPDVKEENILLLDDGMQVKTALVAGAHKQKVTVDGVEKEIVTPVDYAVIAQPALQMAIGALKQQSVETLKVITSFRAKAQEASNGEQPWVLQAGLYVHKDLYAEHKAVFDAKLASIDSNIDDVIDNPEKVKTTISSKIVGKDAEESDKMQAAKFGCPAKIIPAVSKNKSMPNGFGFIKSTEYASIDIQSFLNFIGVTGDLANFNGIMLER